MNRLETIVSRQRKNRVRDLLFAAFVGLATILAATSVATACSAATTTHLVQR